jgi:hypothetical protein
MCLKRTVNLQKRGLRGASASAKRFGCVRKTVEASRKPANQAVYGCFQVQGSRAFTVSRAALHVCYSHMQKSHLRKNAAALLFAANQIVPAAHPRGVSENKHRVEA